jgi:hypothetical protein
LGTVVPKDGPTIKTPELADELKALEQYHDDFALAFPLLVGEDDATNVRYGEMGVPMTVMIDRQGVIRHIAQGYRPAKDIPIIERLLGAEGSAARR